MSVHGEHSLITLVWPQANLALHWCHKLDLHVARVESLLNRNIVKGQITHVPPFLFISVCRFNVFDHVFEQQNLVCVHGCGRSHPFLGVFGFIWVNKHHGG